MNHIIQQTMRHLTPVCGVNCWDLIKWNPDSCANGPIQIIDVGGNYKNIGNTSPVWISPLPVGCRRSSPGGCGLLPRHCGHSQPVCPPWLPGWRSVWCDSGPEEQVYNHWTTHSCTDRCGSIIGLTLKLDNQWCVLLCKILKDFLMCPLYLSDGKSLTQTLWRFARCFLGSLFGTVLNSLSKTSIIWPLLLYFYIL